MYSCVWAGGLLLAAELGVPVARLHDGAARQTRHGERAGDAERQVQSLSLTLCQNE